MSGILLSASPVDSYRAFRSRGPKHLRDISKQQYSEAVTELEKCHVGVVVVSENGALSFLKRPPGEIKENLQQNFSDLCSFAEYTMRFSLPTPSAVSLNQALQEKIKELGVGGLVYRK